ncbi:hypothetical protein GCM10023093_08770 [Nemorincola caseinilytica]|uniref:Uncharacterized protein n=1 Tax=Nemorincola caseinilytica TaxID=2054315 RepID=A0ABP8N6W1_9BACT
MNTLTVIKKQPRPSSSWLAATGKRLRKYINDLFRPEVVEVTFKMEGDSVTYTYTKVDEKKVA